MRQRVKIVIKEDIVRELYAIAGEDAVQTAEPMKNHTTFRVGGPADYFVAPHTEEEIRKIVALCEEKEIPWFVTGNGSNLVVSDEGYHGVILSVYKNFQGIEVEENRIRAKAGSMLVSISQAAREAGLSGMEFASGIPGNGGGKLALCRVPLTGFHAGNGEGRQETVALFRKHIRPAGEDAFLDNGQVADDLSPRLAGFKGFAARSPHVRTIGIILLPESDIDFWILSSAVRFSWITDQPMLLVPRSKPMIFFILDIVIELNFMYIRIVQIYI